MTTGSIKAPLWILPLLASWLAILCLAAGWYARRKFRTFLKAPLSEEVEHLTHVWEKRVNRWTVLGWFTAGLSILGLIGWLVAERFVP